MTTPYAEVIGDPIGHSKSPLIHKFWLNKVGIEGDYRTCHVRPEELPDFIARRRDDANWRGCNVTIPHKIAVMDLVEDPGDVRSSIGAMNTVLRDPRSHLTGTNTDAAGFYAPLSAIDLSDAPVAVVGTGGAARAVFFALAKADVGEITIIARTPMKGAALLAQFGLKGRVQGFDTALPPAVLLVNASSLGMVGQPDYMPDLSPLPDNAIVYDLVYAPLETPLLAAAHDAGFDTIDGLTGSIGMGKSTVAAMLRDLGVPVFDADAEVHQLQGPGGALVDEIESVFPGTTGPAGVDRHALGARVLNDDAALKQLEAIVHPAVAQARQAFLVENAGEPLIVFDIPLLLEKGGDTRLDAIWVVSASSDVQRARVLARPGMTPGKLESILARQMPDAEKRAHATAVIDTGTALDVTRAQIAALVTCIKSIEGQ